MTDATSPSSTRSPGALFAGLAAALVVVMIVHLGTGSVFIPPAAVGRILLGLPVDHEPWVRIVLDYRLPRLIVGVLAGAALAGAGLQMQTLFRNPLAGPFVLGINSGASLAVALVVMGTGAIGGERLLSGVGLGGSVGIILAASVGSAAVLVLVLLVARRVASSMTLLILGLMFGYATGAVVQLLFYFSPTHSMQAYVGWTFGSFANVTRPQLLAFAAVLLVGLAGTWVLVKPLNALLLGETYARSMGLNVGLTRGALIGCTALLAGGVTAFCGPIGFIGIAVPHLCRALWNTADHRVLVPGCILAGALVAVVADMIAQLPGSQTTLPLNAVCSLIGAPVVIGVILRRRSLRESFAS